MVHLTITVSFVAWDNLVVDQPVHIVGKQDIIGK